MLGEYDFEVRKETGNKMTVQSITEILEEISRFYLYLEPFWKLLEFTFENWTILNTFRHWLQILLQNKTFKRQTF